MIPAYQLQWAKWRSSLTDGCKVRSQYHTRCWAPHWAPNHWYHYQNSKGQCMDFFKDFWVALWHAPDRDALIAHVAFDSNVPVTNIFQYRTWLVQRWNSSTLLINGIVLVHEWFAIHDPFDSAF
ncbi:hypothetical protein SISNIDRAFT_490635 [Sistotremastrum niveocremeum HHB9708]|uniref:Uncharacterized protein n=1 Tax=Sistotremastrum niveocremeum HHB9708 TaxID=1314777 RepID=A0A164NLK8_9AGAM|nr:hypothetical protein SISNIDRAFT_490635 [Sistotremastrum niveocremeum HHB9708]